LPALDGHLYASALVASSSRVIIPLAAAPEALDGFVQVSANLQRLRGALDLPIPIVAVVPTRYDQRLRIARDVLDAAKTLCNGTLTAPIRENVVLRELFGHRQPVRKYRPDSTGAADYAVAMRSATAPVSCSSGKTQAVRLNVGGNRQLNRLLHVIATVRLRAPAHPGRIYYDRKRSEGKTGQSALRALKRTLATVVYYRLRLCQARIENINVLIAA